MSASSRASSSKEVAINAFNVAYDFDYPNRPRYQKIAVSKFFDVDNFIYSWTEQRINASYLKPTQSELSFNDLSLTGIWVGMRPSVEAYIHARSEEHGSRFSPKIPRSVDFDSKALRVVATVHESMVKYYCLGNQKDGLCEAFRTDIEEVYFFDEYRDATAISPTCRMQVWNEKVENACKTRVETSRSKGNGSPAEPERAPVREKDAVTCMSNSTIDAANRATEQPKPKESDRTTTLYMLVASNQVLSLQECEQVIKELYTFAPEMEKEALQPGEIQKISEALVQTQNVLDFRILHDFIVLFVEYFRSNGDKSNQALVVQARRNAQKMCAWRFGRTMVRTDDFKRYLEGETRKQQEFLDLAALCATHALKVGRQGIARSLQAEVAELEAHVKRLEDLRSTLPKAQVEKSQSVQLNGRTPPTRLTRSRSQHDATPLDEVLALHR